MSLNAIPMCLEIKLPKELCRYLGKIDPPITSQS